MNISQLLNSPIVKIKLVTIVHYFLFVTCGLFGKNVISLAYFFYNILFILTLFWSIHCKESIEAVHTAAIFDALSIAFDLFTVFHFFSNNFVISGIFAVINLVARPFSLLLLYRELIDRGGNLLGGISSVDQEDRQCQNIKGSAQSLPTNNQYIKNIV